MGGNKSSVHLTSLSIFFHNKNQSQITQHVSSPLILLGISPTKLCQTASESRTHFINISRIIWAAGKELNVEIKFSLRSQGTQKETLYLSVAVTTILKLCENNIIIQDFLTEH